MIPKECQRMAKMNIYKIKEELKLRDFRVVERAILNRQLQWKLNEVQELRAKILNIDNEIALLEGRKGDKDGNTNCNV